MRLQGGSLIELVAGVRMPLVYPEAARGLTAAAAVPPANLDWDGAGASRRERATPNPALLLVVQTEAGAMMRKRWLGCWAAHVWAPKNGWSIFREASHVPRTVGVMTDLLEYLLDQEKEERNERRALEQRAAGLILALLVALPVAGNLAGQTDREGLGFVGLIGSGLALVAALAIAARIAGQLADKDAAAGEAPSGAELRKQVAVALEAGDERNAAAAQRQLLGKLRGRNQQLADRVKTETGLLPLVLVLFLISLALMAADPDGSAPQQRPNPSDMSVHPSR